MSISISPSVIVGTSGRPRRAGSPGDDDRPGEQLLGRERDRQDVVDPEIEGPELGREVAPARQAEDRRHAGSQRVGRPQALQDLRGCPRGPCRARRCPAPSLQDPRGLGEVLGGPHDEQPVVQGQLDQVDDERTIVEHERAPGIVRRSRSQLQPSSVRPSTLAPRQVGAPAILSGRSTMPVATISPTETGCPGSRAMTSRNDGPSCTSEHLSIWRRCTRRLPGEVPPHSKGRVGSPGLGVRDDPTGGAAGSRHVRRRAPRPPQSRTNRPRKSLPSLPSGSERRAMAANSPIRA